MPSSPQNYFNKSLPAISVLILFTPSITLALDLAQSPPGTVDPYVAPNVIISIDDSGSMDFRLDRGNATGASNRTSPNADGIWGADSRRINVLKHALTEVFNDKSLLPDEKIRLGWQAMWNNGGAKGENNVGSTNAKNNIKKLDSSHRDNFLTFVKKIDAGGGTPTHLMLQQADVYLRATKNNKPIEGGPWATNPDTNDALSKEFLSCRRNYHIVMTDGRWNGTPSGGNRESQSIKLPDGTQYTPNSNQTRVFYDNYSNNLADWAFYSWSENLQPSIYDANDSKKQISLSSEYRRAPDSENIGGVTVNKYWNPKYNPANWPHLVTYTIGFSEDAITWPGANDIKRPSETVPFGYDGSFPDFVSGAKNWPQMNNENRRALDLWHAAINGRGRFYAVSKGEDLEKAFREIIGVINTQAEPDRSSVAVSGISAQDKPVGLFITSNSPKEAWKGEVRAFEVTASGQTERWGGKTTAAILDNANAPEDRKIITWGENKGVPFRWNSLSNAQKTCLNVRANSVISANCATNTATDQQGEKRLKYIRGDRDNELSKSNGIFRNRYSAQGDIVNSNVWYTGAPISNYAFKGYADFVAQWKERTPIIYVGGNDGMLHGFSAKEGSEEMAYIPRAVQPNLTRLTWPSFDDNHRYFVDGSPMTGDIDLSDRTSSNHTPDWRTMLVGSLGAGGKGYFVLDVTNPEYFTEKNAASLVVMDKTLHSEEAINCDATTTTGNNACVNTPSADIGHIFAIPSTDDSNPLHTNQITLLNNNRWAVIMGNGYNSKNGRPVLLIQYLDGNKELVRLPATATNATGEDVTDNGLSAPRLVDINNDGRPDVVYAGDLKGNMWKFMIASKESSKWGAAFDNKPLFIARGGASGSPDTRTLPQSITAPPTVRANDRLTTTGTGKNKKTLAVGGMMVAFGTGRNITTSDPESINIQTIYSVLDNTRYENNQDSDDSQHYVSVRAGDTSKSIPAPSPLGTGLNNASQQTLLAQQRVGSLFAGQQKSEGREYWQIDPTSATDAPSVDWNTQRGWYLDLPQTGERLLKPMGFYDGSNILAIYTQVPAKGSDKLQTLESCEAPQVDEERQYLSLINIMDGKRPSVQLMDMNGDGFYNLSTDHGVSRMKVVKGAHRIIGHKAASTDYGKGDAFDLARMPEQSLRPSWRQLK